MLTAILADIHGNLEALQAVWADLREFAADRIVCLGDMIGYGPDPDAVLCAVRGRGAACCMGNHEHGVAFRRRRSWFNPTARKGLTQTERLLSEKNRKFIAELPLCLLVEGARFVHGFPPEDVFKYLYDVRDDCIEAWWAHGERLTFVGHTHDLVLVRRDGGQVKRTALPRGRFFLDHEPCIVNVGSVGQPRDGNNNAKYVLWDSVSGTVDVRFVPYDIERTVRKIRARNFPEYSATRLW